MSIQTVFGKFWKQFGVVMELQNEGKPRLCRLCLDVCSSSCKPIDDVTKSMLNTLRITPDPSLSGEPVICENCIEILEKCLRFKSKWLGTENFINSVIKVESDKLSIRDIFLKKQGTKEEEWLKGQTVCRLCLELAKRRGSVLLNDCNDDKVSSFLMVLNQYYPELNMTITKYPIICEDCQSSLLGHLVLTGKRSSMENCCKVEIKSEEEQTTPDIPELIPDSAIKCEKSSYDLNAGQTFDEAAIGIIIPKDEDVEPQEINIKPEEVEIKMEPLDSPRLDVSIGSTDKSDHVVNTPIHSCLWCNYKTKCKQTLKEHLLVHTDTSSVLNCRNCDFKTKHRGALTRHEKVFHGLLGNIRTYGCDVCDYETKYRGNIKIHKLVHLNLTDVKTYRCSECTFETKYKTSLKGHMLTHGDSANEAMYHCDMCPYKARFQSLLEKHKRSHGVEEYQCEHCDFKSKHLYALNRHTVAHQDNVDTSRHKVAHQCDQCEYKTRHKYNLKRHMLVHKKPTDQITHKCRACPYETAHKHHLTNHELVHHASDVAKYNCKTCEFQTGYKRSLDRHLVRRHRGKKVKTPV